MAGARPLVAFSLSQSTPPPWLQPRWHDRYREILGAERSRFRAWPRPEQAANVFGGISALDGMESFFAERCGLEVRQTYADPDMIELMLTLPTSMSWRRGTYKWAVEMPSLDACQTMSHGGKMREHVALLRDGMRASR
ncbi:MAG: hypothetical protein IPO66_01960 [Rhodanobacteraceae bacterium]|nr:hypothetical protein [Rhodanobacteraceae bacterium]